LDLILCIFLIIFIVWDFVSWFDVDKDSLINVSKYVSLRTEYYNYQWELVVCFLVTWIATIKLIQALITINSQVKMFWSMMKKSSGHLLNFIVLLSVILLTFAISGWTLFSGQLSEFRTIFWAIFSLVNFTFSELFFENLTSSHRILGILYYIMWGVLMPFILINVFVAILMSAWDETTTENDLSSSGPMANTEKRRSWSAWWKSWFQREEVEGKITTMGPQARLTDPKHWRKVYPAGCPKRKLMSYLEQQLGIRPENAEQIVRFVDTDDSGTFEWLELNGALAKLKPSIENSLISMTRHQTKTLTRRQMKMQEELEIMMDIMTGTKTTGLYQENAELRAEVDTLNAKVDELTSLTRRMLEKIG